MWTRYLDRIQTCLAFGLVFLLVSPVHMYRHLHRNGLNFFLYRAHFSIGLDLLPYDLFHLFDMFSFELASFWSYCYTCKDTYIRMTLILFLIHTDISLYLIRSNLKSSTLTYHLSFLALSWYLVTPLHIYCRSYGVGMCNFDIKFGF